MLARRMSRLSDSNKFGKEGYTFSNITQDTRDIEFDYELAQIEREYPLWWSFKMLRHNLQVLPDNECWNLVICALTLGAIVWTIVEVQDILVFEIMYNAMYGLHAVAICHNVFTQQELGITLWQILGMLIDMISFAHFVNPTTTFKMVCYYVRLHRPFRYLFSVSDFNMSGSVWGNTAKFCYIFMVLRISWAFVWLKLNKEDNLEMMMQQVECHHLEGLHLEGHLLEGHHVEGHPVPRQAEPEVQRPTRFLVALHLINEIFILVSSSEAPATDLERFTYLGIMLSGCILVAGIAVASMSLVISLYMRSEEAFRSRYRLIIRETEHSRIPPAQRRTVETFYLMYWKKQRAVSASTLLPTFPPTLPAAIYMDIYFEAMQKSKVLKDLSNQFLAELAQKMTTTHYIPGDSIIKRNSRKNAMIYITYGDVELLTPEDDMTAVLRFTKGSVLSPCGVAALDGFGYAHMEVRAATYCTAHLLSAEDLWKVALKYGRLNRQADAILDFFYRHIENVKKHYKSKVPENAKYKSSIVNLKRSLMGLKEAKNPDGTLLMSRTDYFLSIAGCYIMRNRADAALTDESDSICLRPTFPCILQPTSSLTFAWNCLVSVIVLLIIFVYPYYMIFSSEDPPIEFRFFDHMNTIIYILDIIVHLSTGDNVEQGVAITFAQTASQQMMSLWFVLDVLAVAPIYDFVGIGFYRGINKILKIPKMFRFLRELEFMFVYKSHTIRLCTYTLLIVIVCYLAAAEQHNYMCYAKGFCVVTNFSTAPYWGFQPKSADTEESTIGFSIYWSMAVIIMSSFRKTSSTDDWYYVLYTMMTLEICMLMKLFMHATYAATIMVTSTLSNDYGGTISIVKNFLIRNQVDITLRKRFIQYLHLCWYTDSAYSMTHHRKSIFFDLPPHVYQDIVTKQRSQYIMTLPFMKYLSHEELKIISSSARLFYTSPNEVLLSSGDLVNEIYLIKQGYCETIDPVTQKHVGLLGPKTHFGIVVCLLRVPAYTTIRAVTHVQIFSISRKVFTECLSKTVISETLEFLKQQPEYQILTKRIPPFLTYEPPPRPPNLMRFKLPRKHEPDHAFLMPFFRLGFFSILRYIFPRYTIRPDSTYITAFECARVLCSCTTAILQPCYEYMLPQFPRLRYVMMLMNFMAYVDIFQRLMVGYFNKKGILIYHPASTAAHYIKGAFIVDILAVLPLEFLEPPTYNGSMRLMTQLRTLLSLNRLLQLYRLESVIQILGRYIERMDVLLIIKAIPLFLVLMNVITCFVIFNSVEIIYSNKAGSAITITPLKDAGGSWIQVFEKQFYFNLTESPWNLQLATFYWVSYEIIGTGFNNIEPSNVNMIYILLIGMIIGTIMITHYSVNIISSRANVNKALAEFQENMRDMISYMEKERLDPELQKEVLEHYEYAWDKMGGVDYRHVFKLCDQITLRTDAILHIYGPTFARCPILLQSDTSLLRSLGRSVHSEYFPRGQTIIETNDIVDSIYFVDYGDVNISEISDDVVKLANLKLTRGSLFGNLNNKPCISCPLHVVASTKVHLLMIKSTIFHEIIDDFPTVRPLMKRFRPQPNACFIMSNQRDYNKRRVTRMSTPMVVRGKKGLLRFYFKDSYIQIFLIVTSLFCVSTDVYNAGFQDNRTGVVAALYVLDALFLLKMAIQCLLPVIVDSESLRSVLIPKRNEYFEEEFKIDIASCIPLELFCFLSTENRLILFSWLRLNRILRISTVITSLKKYKERITLNMIFATILSTILWFALFVHCLSCLWYFVGYLEDRAEPGSSWFTKVKPQGNNTGTKYCENEYVCSMYFILTVFTRNGIKADILPRKQSEVIFVIVLQLASMFMLMMYVGELSNILHYQSFRCFSFYYKYLELQDYLTNNRVSKNLVAMVNRYCQHLWREARGMQLPQFILQAPRALRLKIMCASYLHHLTRHHVFEDCDPSFLRQVAGCLKVFIYNEGMYVVKTSEITDCMYLIHRGDVQELDLSMPEGEQITRVYPAGSYFGVLQGLFHNEPFTRSYQTLVNTTILTLHLDDWVYLLQHYPESRDAINQHMRRDEGRKISTVSSTNWAPLQKYQKKSDFHLKSESATNKQSVTSAAKPAEPVPSAPLQLIESPLYKRKSDEPFAWPTKRQTSDDDLPYPNKPGVQSTGPMKLTETTQKQPDPNEAGPSSAWPVKQPSIDNDLAKNTNHETPAATSLTDTEGVSPPVSFFWKNPSVETNIGLEDASNIGKPIISNEKDKQKSNEGKESPNEDAFMINKLITEDKHFSDEKFLIGISLRDSEYNSEKNTLVAPKADTELEYGEELEQQAHNKRKLSLTLSTLAKTVDDSSPANDNILMRYVSKDEREFKPTENASEPLKPPEPEKNLKSILKKEDSEENPTISVINKLSKENWNTDNIELIEIPIAQESLEPNVSDVSIPQQARSVSPKSVHKEADLSDNPDLGEEKEILSMDISKSKAEDEVEQEQETKVIDLQFQHEHEASTLILLPEEDLKDVNEPTTTAALRRKSVRIVYETNDDDEDEEDGLPIVLPDRRKTLTDVQLKKEDKEK